MKTLLVNANALTIPLADNSVHCVVTSPPYWGLRDYGTATWKGGSPECQHNPQRPDGGERANRTLPLGRGGLYRDTCAKCGAIRIDNQLGLERTPEEYIARMVEVFREVRRVLHPEGVMFLNIGSSYASSTSRQNQSHLSQHVLSYGTDGIVRLGYQGTDYVYSHLCDECLIDFRSGRIDYSTPLLVQSQQHDAKKAHDNGHLDSLTKINDDASPGVQESTSPLSFEQSQGELRHLDNSFSFLSWQNSSAPESQDYAYKMRQDSDAYDYKSDNVLPSAQPQPHNRDNTKSCVLCGSSFDLHNDIQKDYTIKLKPKDDIGIPWRLAFALQADGWWLRSDIIWAKPNPMPESVTDRPTKAHEYVFLMTKSSKYFWDQEGVREELSDPARTNFTAGHKMDVSRNDGDLWQRSRDFTFENGRNLRSVWTIATQPYSGAHYATFPEALVEKCIRAGTSERGCCPECGKQWRRVVEKNRSYESGWAKANNPGGNGKYGEQYQGGGKNIKDIRFGPTIRSETLGWQPSCKHDCEPIPSIVFDPFIGSGTTSLVARRLGRRSIGLDLSLKYLTENARKRLSLDKLDAWTRAVS